MQAGDLTGPVGIYRHGFLTHKRRRARPSPPLTVPLDLPDPPPPADFDRLDGELREMDVITGSELQLAFVLCALWRSLQKSSRIGLSSQPANLQVPKTKKNQNQRKVEKTMLQ